jgi:hypothetical protein
LTATDQLAGLVLIGFHLDKLLPFPSLPLWSSSVNLQAECDKACNTLKAFRQPELVSNISDKNLAKYIPENILAHAKGLAFLTVIKAGFIWSGRLGTGIVVARLPDHSTHWFAIELFLFFAFFVLSLLVRQPFFSSESLTRLLLSLSSIFS